MRLRDMKRRCAGAVVATGVARGEMGEHLIDDLGRLDARDDPQRAATHATVFDVDVEDSLEPLHPAHGRTTRRMGLAGGVTRGAGDDAAAVFEVRGEHAVVPGEMGAGAWYEGGEAGDEVHRVEHDMSRSVMEGVLESTHDLSAVIDREAFVRDGRASDVAAKPFEGVPLMGSAAGAGQRWVARKGKARRTVAGEDDRAHSCRRECR